MSDPAVIQGANSGKPKPPKGKPFVKADPRINRHGRPKTSDQLRKLVLELAAEETGGKGKPTRIVAMLRKMLMSKNTADRKEILDRGWGKVKEEVELSGNANSPIIVKAFNYALAVAAITAGPEPDSTAPGEDQDGGHGPALGQDDDGG